MLGKVLGNRYTIVEKIGEGGMALVYKAKCSLLNRYVAVKVLRHEFVNDEEFIDKFRREAQAAASLSHSNIVNVYDVGVEDDIYYIVMEYIDGKTLKDIIKEKGKMTTKETVDISMKVVDALIHAHANKVIHRDIKPHNIMVLSDGRLKVTDFGIARAATSSTITSTNSVMGSAHYFSPEQARGGYTDEKSDIYSVGIMMYEMCTGKLPFSGDSPVTIAIKHIQEDALPPTEVDPTVSKELEAIIMKCIQKTQGDRYKNSQELLKDLKNVNSEKSKSAPIITNNDSSATQLMPALDDTVLMKNTEAIIGTGAELPVKKSKKKKVKKEKPKKEKPKKEKNKSNKIMAIGAILLALIIVITGTGIILGLKGAIADPEIIIPDLVGMTQAEATKSLEDLDLRLNIMGYRESDQDKGKVTEQRDKPGEKVKKGFAVKVIVSSGKTIGSVTVPNLFGKTVEESERILRESGLEISEKINYEDSEYQEDTVISQSPKVSEEVEEGTKVVVVVSRGRETVALSVPILKGLSEGEAKKLLEAENLKLGNVRYEDSEEEKGKIISQTPRAGVNAEEGTSVDIIISKGSKIQEEKEEEEQKEQEQKDQENEKAEEKEEEEKEDEVLTFQNITLPQNGNEMVAVKVIRDQDGVATIVYNTSHPVADGEITLKVRGKEGNASLRIYMDERLQENRNIKF